MTNTQLWLAVGVPTFAVLISIVINLFNQVHLNARLASIESRLNVIESDLRRFWQILGEHGARLDALDRK